MLCGFVGEHLFAAVVLGAVAFVVAVVVVFALVVVAAGLVEVFG